MSPLPSDDDSDSSDSDDNTLMLATLLNLSIEAASSRRRRYGIPQCVIERDHSAGENLICHHYFGPNPMYPPTCFVEGTNYIFLLLFFPLALSVLL
jgi:hypothetical protein